MQAEARDFGLPAAGNGAPLEGDAGGFQTRGLRFRAVHGEADRADGGDEVDGGVVAGHLHCRRVDQMHEQLRAFAAENDFHRGRRIDLHKRAEMRSDERAGEIPHGGGVRGGVDIPHRTGHDGDAAFAEGRFEGGGSAAAGGVEFRIAEVEHPGVSRLDVDGCFIEVDTTDFGTDFSATTIGIGGEWGLWGQEIMNGKIRNCVFRRLRHGIYCELNNNTVIEYNRFQGVGSFRYELASVIASSINQGSNQFRAKTAAVDAGLIAEGMKVGFNNGANSEYRTIQSMSYDSYYGNWQCTISGMFQYGYDGSPGQSFYSQPPSSGITAGDNTYETFICFNYFDGGGNGYLDINAVRNTDTNIGLLNAYIIGNMSETLFVGTDKPTVKLQTSPYSFSGGDILFLGNTFAGQIFIDGSNTVAFICCDNNIGSIDATAYEGRVVFNNNLCHGSVKLKNAATASGNYVMGSLQVISGTTEKTLAVGNYVENGMTLAGDYSIAANNVIENGGLSVGGKGSRASGNSVRGTLTLGFWGSATGNVIRTTKQVAISAIVPRAQIAGNACLDEFNILSQTDSQKFYATGTSCTFYTAGHVDNFEPGYCITFQSSKDIETRMITSKSGNTIYWADALNSSYGGTSNTAWAYTNLAHIDGVSSLSVVTGNFVCGDINVTGGVNLSCMFVGSSCVVNGNRVLGMMVTTAAAKKNVVIGNIFTNSKAVQPGWPKAYPFVGNPDNSNEIAHNIINGSVI